MKKVKRVLAMLATFVMVLAMGMTASAAEITISGGAEGSEYAAYKLLNATDGGEGKFAYTLNEKYAGALEKVTGKTDEREIVDYISALNAEETRTFADAVYAEVRDLDADYTTTNDKFEGVEQGYYLIAETKTGNDEDTYSLVMLDTAGNDAINVTTKEDKPVFEKKVKEKNDSTGVESGWQDGADYDIGDAVPFQLTGTVEAKYDNYTTYYYAFHDTLSAGLTFNNDVKVYVDGTEITTGYTVVTEGLENGESFNVVFDDLKATPAQAGSKIVVEYTATLNEDAVIGQPGNPNMAKLVYSNNPYGDEKGETPEDKVTVFTYKVVANKVDKDGNALAGAGFTLYKYDANAADYVAVGAEITGVTEFTFTGLDAGQYKLVETTVPAGYNQADDLEFTVKAEYDTNSDDPKLTKLVVVDKDGNEITEFTFDLANGTVSTNIVNLSGTELPSTGGIGTKIFYTVGAILMIGAAVVLITRKRTSQAK
ncbi:MAG: isopeptide-forming domain-containing fimbrial protein [Roseburia sp.]